MLSGYTSNYCSLPFRFEEDLSTLQELWTMSQ